MADSDKNIVITPNTGAAADPKIVFSSGATSGDPITLSTVDDGTTSTLSFEGSAGQLFSISNDLTGTIFSVADGSGIPIIEADADGDIRLAEFGGTLEYGGPFREKVVTTTISGATANIDVSAASIYDITLAASTTITFTNSPPSGKAQTLLLILRQDATGSRTCAVTNAKYTDGTAPVLSTGANDIDVVSYFTVDGGSNWFGSFVMANLS